MTKQEEEARIAAGVQKQMEKIAAAQQKQFAKTLQKAMKDALKGVDKANAALAKERIAVQKQLDAARKEHAKAEKEADKMADKYFEGRQKQFRESARTELLRDLVRMHLSTGKNIRDIAVWLDVPQDFVKNIREVLERSRPYNNQKPMIILEGNPVLRYEGGGRGGTIWFESGETKFDMWWEFAGNDAVAIVGIPGEEQWEKRTGFPAERRSHVLNFIGEQIVRDKLSGSGSFIIGDDVLTFYP